MAKISNSAIIVICIFGAAAGVCLAWGVFTVIDRAGFWRNPHAMDAEQQKYMREARMRNQEQLRAGNGYGRGTWNGQSYGPGPSYPSYGPSYDSKVQSTYTTNSLSSPAGTPYGPPPTHGPSHESKYLSTYAEDEIPAPPPREDYQMQQPAPVQEHNIHQAVPVEEHKMQAPMPGAAI